MTTNETPDDNRHAFYKTFESQSRETTKSFATALWFFYNVATIHLREEQNWYIALQRRIEDLGASFIAGEMTEQWWARRIQCGNDTVLDLVHELPRHTSLHCLHLDLLSESWFYRYEDNTSLRSSESKERSNHSAKERSWNLYAKSIISAAFFNSGFSVS